MQRGEFVAGEASSSGGCARGFAFGHCGPLCQLGACWSASPLMPPLVAFGCAWGFAFGRSGPLCQLDACWSASLLMPKHPPQAVVPGGSRSGVVGRCVGDVSCCRRGTCRCVPPLIAPRVVACDRVCWGLVVRWAARRMPSSLAASSGRNPDTRLSVGRALLIGQAIVVGFVCPVNPNR